LVFYSSAITRCTVQETSDSLEMTEVFEFLHWLSVNSPARRIIASYTAAIAKLPRFRHISSPLTQTSH